MTYSDLEPSANAITGRRGRAPDDSSPFAVPTTGVTVFGCCPDTAVVFGDVGPRLGLTPTVTDEVISPANAELARGNRCVSVSHTAPITEPTLLALSRAGVEYVSTRSIGYDHIDIEYAAHVGISVGNVQYSPAGVADYTVMLILMAVRQAKTTFRRADMHDYRLSDRRGREMRDLTVGVIGTGRIGTAVIDRLQGFGCRVLAHDRRPDASAEYLPLDELLQFSDVVTLHTPLTADTHHLLDRLRIERMKDGAYIVNTGRGALLDTEALLSALESGRLSGAALDVVEGEEGIFYADHRDRPIENDALVRLQRMPNVLISPHCAYHTDRALNDAVENSLLNCLNHEGRKAL